MADDPLLNTPFREELEALINKHNVENGSNTPDFILATLLVGQLAMFDIAIRTRDKWYGAHLEPGKPHFIMDASGAAYHYGERASNTISTSEPGRLNDGD